MKRTNDMLLIADRTVSEQLAPRLGEGRCVSLPDPYDALLEMSRHRWSAVLLTAPRANFAGLARASRRLQRDSKVFALCPPTAEPDVKPLAGRVLDDYFIYPPTASEWERIISITDARSNSKQPEQQEIPALGTGELAKMLAAARRVADLESHIATTVAKRISAPVE
ncbi:MAG: hypothetical protein ACYSTL_04305, partial [Planctomycetota bacterium]